MKSLTEEESNGTGVEQRGNHRSDPALQRCELKARDRCSAGPPAYVPLDFGSGNGSGSSAIQGGSVPAVLRSLISERHQDLDSFELLPPNLYWLSLIQHTRFSESAAIDTLMTDTAQPTYSLSSTNPCSGMPSGASILSPRRWAAVGAMSSIPTSGATAPARTPAPHITSPVCMLEKSGRWP